MTSRLSTLLLGGLVTALLALPAAPAAAAEGGADTLVKGVTDDVLGVLRNERQGDEGASRRQATTVIETKIAPHFDFPRMTALAVGRAWREASPEQREALTKAFRTLLVRTYANALAQYRDQTVDVKQARPGPGEGEASVHSQINQPGGQPVAVDYRLSRKAGEWKVYDVAVDHVSLVTTYRSSFANELDKGGIDALLRALEAKTRSVAAPSAGLGGDGQAVARRQGDVQYVSGDIGLEHMGAAGAPYNLGATFAVKGGDLVGEVHVVVRNAQAATLLDVRTEGPRLLVRLPPDHYRIAAEFGGRTVVREAAVAPGRLTEVEFVWPVGDSVASAAAAL